MIKYPLKNHQIILLLFFTLFISCQENNKKISILNFDPNLKKTERGWIYKGKPFSGFMIQEEKDHRIVYQLPIENSKEQGMAKGWYNSGEKLLERFYSDGKREGIFKQWWPNGRLRYLFNYENDVFQGKQIVHFPDGKIREESNYQSGEKEGIQRVWDEKGLLISNYTIKNKKLYGVITVKSCIPTGH